MQPKNNRILTIDLLRGYFLFIIIIDHVFHFPNIFSIFTGQGQLWVSAAEGFFIISGMLVGLIYYPKIQKSFKGVCVKLWKRAGKLYLSFVGITLFLTILGNLLPDSSIRPGIWPDRDWIAIFLNTVSLRYMYGLADFLAYYVVFMLFAPLALIITQKLGSRWTVLISFFLWVIRGNSFFLAWQILFITGIIFGLNLPYLETKFKTLDLKKRLLFSKILGFGALSTLTLSIVFVFGLTSPVNIYASSGQLQTKLYAVSGLLNNAYSFVASIFDKNTLGIGRLILAWLWFIALFLLVRSREFKIVKTFGKLFLPLGQNSLFVYGLQAIIIFPVNSVLANQSGFIQNSAVTLLILSIIYFITISKNRLMEVAAKQNISSGSQ